MTEESVHHNGGQLPQTPPSLSKKCTDNESQLTQSTVLRRLVRKTGDNSVSRGSSSRKSSEKSSESMNVSQFYIKMTSSQSTNHSLTTSIRSDILNRREDQKYKKKREPTPAPGQITRKRSTQKVSKKELEIQSDLLIAEMQKKLADQREKTKFFEKRAQLNEKQLKIKTNKIIELQRRLMIELQKENVLESKLKSFEDLATKNQARLVQNKSSLQRMRKSIQQSRLAEIQGQNAKLKKENQTLKDLNQQLTYQFKTASIKCNNLERQLCGLKNLSKVLPETSKNAIQEGNELKVKNEYTIQLQNTISKLEIKLNYLNRRKNAELQKLRQKKNEELAKIRNKLSIVNEELKEFRKQHQKLVKKMTFTERTTLMTSEIWPTHEEAFCLSLSP